MKYSDNIDYLFVAIEHLGANPYFWGRTAKEMARDLHLNQSRLRAVFDGFPGLFRQSPKIDPEHNEPYYELQARMALKKLTKETDLDTPGPLEPLSVDRMEMVMNFVLKMVEQEARDNDREAQRLISLRTNVFSAICAGVAAVAAVGAVLLR